MARRSPIRQDFRVFTICARNYIAHARVLAESLHRADKSLRLAVLMLDDEERTIVPADQNFDVIRPDELPFADAHEFHRMAAIYDVTELATAVKPWVFRHLFDRGAEAVIYLDPDIEVFSALDDLERAAREHGLVLTPHTLKPLPRDGRIPSERDLLLAGTYNLGFLGVGKKSAETLLPWWCERLRRDCRNAVESGYFVDQRWMDFVPSYFDHFIVRDPGCNVAYWNLPTRTLAMNGKSFTVDGSPLRFFHFSGFSPERRHLLSKHQGLAPRILLSDQPALASLCNSYADNLLQNGFEKWSKVPYTFDKTAGGLRLDRRVRRAYRDALLEYELKGTASSLPDPFTVDGARDLVDWLRYPASPQMSDISRYVYEIYKERSDLRAAFPDLASRDGERYCDWIRNGGLVDPPIPAELMPEGRSTSAAAERTTATGDLQRGVNLYGYVFAESGTGQIGRCLVAALKAAGIPYAVIPFTKTINRQTTPFADYGSGAAIYDTNLICVNADQVPVFVEEMGRDILNGRYNIGVWAWEVEEFPETMARSASLLDEVWGISQFAAAAIGRKVSGIPVRAFPLPVLAPPVVERSREELGLPGGFLFLFCFDFESIFERKNPLALIDAFRRAFPSEGEASLYIKTVNGHRHVPELERLRAQAAGRADIVIADGYRSAADQTALMASCDAYVSLHRAEGFGLTLAEAMSFGKPVIGTAYSSTAEFMTRSNSYLVPFDMVRIGEGNSPYPPQGLWAEPHVDAAARSMRAAFDDRSDAAARGRRALEDVVSFHSAEARASMLREYLADIEERRASAIFARDTATTTSALQTKDAIGQIIGPSAVPPATERPDERAERLIWGPNPDLPSRFPRVAGFLRRLMLRFIRNYWVHQREVDRTLLNAIRTGGEQARMEMTVMNERLSRKVAALETELRQRRAMDTAAHLQIERHEEATTADAGAYTAIVANRVKALDDVATRLSRQNDANARAIRHLNERDGAIASRLASLEQDAADVRNRFVEIASSFADTLNRTSESGLSLTDAREHMNMIEARLAGAVNELREMFSRAGLADGPTADIAARLARAEEAVKRLSAELHAVPYVSDSHLIRTTGNAAAEVIGYRNESGKEVPTFDEIFRGPEEFIRERQRVYVPYLRGAAPVLDLGCGRGEMLDLLKQNDIGAVGIELNDRLAAYCRRKGHTVHVADAISYLAGQPDGSIGAVFSAQFIEHIDQSQLEDFFALAKRKLRPGGVLIAETVNPHSIPAMKCFWVDPTHKTPIFPETAVALCRLAGFGEAQVMFPNGSGTLADDIFAQGEYAIVAHAIAATVQPADTAIQQARVRPPKQDMVLDRIPLMTPARDVSE